MLWQRVGALAILALCPQILFRDEIHVLPGHERDSVSLLFNERRKAARVWCVPFGLAPRGADVENSASRIT
jgi:hypothetical protein